MVYLATRKRPTRSLMPNTMKYFYTILILLAVKFGFSQFGGNSYSQISELKKQGLTVLVPDDECKRKACKQKLEWNKHFKETVIKHFDFCEIKFLKLTKENKEKYKDSENAFYLEFYPDHHSKTSSSGVYSDYYINYILISNKEFKEYVDKKNIVAGYRLGKNLDDFPEEYHSFLPTVFKILNQFLHDAEENKSNKLEIISSKNSKGLKLDEIYIFRGHVLDYVKKEEKLKERFGDVNIKLVGIEEILNFVFDESNVKKGLIFPNGTPHGVDKGNFYYIVQGGTGKVVDAYKLKGLKFNVFTKKDIEELSLRIKRKFM